MANEWQVNKSYKSKNADGITVVRTINSMTDNLIYYTVKVGNKEEDGSYAVSKKHFGDLISKVYDR